MAEPEQIMNYNLFWDRYGGVYRHPVNDVYEYAYNIHIKILRHHNRMR